MFQTQETIHVPPLVRCPHRYTCLCQVIFTHFSDMAQLDKKRILQKHWLTIDTNLVLWYLGSEVKPWTSGANGIQFPADLIYLVALVMFANPGGFKMSLKATSLCLLWSTMIQTNSWTAVCMRGNDEEHAFNRPLKRLNLVLVVNHIFRIRSK